MKILQDTPLSQLLWYQIGGDAKYILQCENREDILEAIEFIRQENIKKVVVCGIGSNLIFPDTYFDGAVIQIMQSQNGDIHITPEGDIEAFAGVRTGDVALFTFAHKRVGFEWAGGLPGTIGAAVRGNAGAYGGEIKDILVSATILDYSGIKPAIRILSNEELQFVYRGSLVKYQKGLIVVSATFRLREGTDAEVREAVILYEDHISNRKAKHPLEYRNCGSVFKNIRDEEEIRKVLTIYPELKDDVEQKWYGKVAMASLIEKLGLKGYRVGNAQISEKHALFIVNLGGAKARDVLSIIKKVQDTFRDTFGFVPEPEVEIIK